MILLVQGRQVLESTQINIIYLRNTITSMLKPVFHCIHTCTIATQKLLRIIWQIDVSMTATSHIYPDRLHGSEQNNDWLRYYDRNTERCYISDVIDRNDQPSRKTVYSAKFGNLSFINADDLKPIKWFLIISRWVAWKTAWQDWQLIVRRMKWSLCQCAPVWLV